MEKKGNLNGIWYEWEKLAGSQLAKNCQPLNLQRGILIVGVTHPQWLQALQYNLPQLLGSLRAAGHDVKDIRIKQYHLYPKESLEDEKTIWEKHPSRFDMHETTACRVCQNPCPSGENKIWGMCSFCRRKQLNKM